MGGGFHEIISLENLFAAWREFRRGKRKKVDVQEFEYHLEDNVFKLHEDLRQGTYRHGLYTQFRINDPKQRLISKASVRDRLVHRAVYRVLCPFFDTAFIYNSFSCRVNKGTHAGFRRLVQLTRKESLNYRRPCWALKCDVKKFFDSVDHATLLFLLKKKIVDNQALKLLRIIIDSFHFQPGTGMPLGNLTSQLFANVYLDPLDKYIVHRLKQPAYLRYADDFILLGDTEESVASHLEHMRGFLRAELHLAMHPQKIIFRKLSWGIDFVGYVALPHYAVPRRKTVRRMFKRINAVSLPSYLGYLKQVNAYGIIQKLYARLS